MTVDRQIVFEPNVTERRIDFMVENDDIALEPTEILPWNLEIVGSVERASVDPYNTTNIQIVDDDGK